MSKHPGSDCADVGARERPVFPVRSADLPWAALAPATARSSWVLGLCPWRCRADGHPCPLTGPARGVAAPVPGGRGTSRWLLRGGQRGLPATVLARVRGGRIEVAVAWRRARGRGGLRRRHQPPRWRPDALAARTRVARVRRWCAHHVPADARDRVGRGAIPPALDDRRYRPRWRPAVGGRRDAIPIARLSHARAARTWAWYGWPSPALSQSWPGRPVADTGGLPCGPGHGPVAILRGCASSGGAVTRLRTSDCAVSGAGLSSGRFPWLRRGPDLTGCHGHPRSCRHGLAGVARWVGSLPCGQPLVPPRSSEPPVRFFRIKQFQLEPRYGIEP
jgi:hypothetical protein